MEVIKIGTHPMSIQELVTISRNRTQVILTKNAETEIREARQLVDQWLDQEKVIYGITTGFGALSHVTISKNDAQKLQENILKSHASGVGSPFDPETTRAIMALRIKDLAKGHSGIKLLTVKRLVDFLNYNLLPLIPEKGSVGASGDLVPLAHLALILTGKGYCMYQGRRMTGKTALKKVKIDPLKLAAAEGLALINGTQVMTAIGVLCCHDALRLSKICDIASSMSLEVLMGSRMEFNPLIHQVRPHPGQRASADNMLRITKNSEIISSHEDCRRVQDAYTLRCSPQVHGASKDAIFYAKKVMEIEMNASTNNPIIFKDRGTYLLGGNFHGQPVAMALDFLGIALSELANISERRVERLVNPKLSGLPAFLVKDTGINSGFMITQYVAASLVSENKVLSHPACVDSIPTSANKEDHVSMGTISARKCREILKNAESVLAIELFCAAQALDLFTNMKPGEGTLAAYQVIREKVDHLKNDRILSNDIEKIKKLIHSSSIIDAVEEKVGKLH